MRIKAVGFDIGQTIIQYNKPLNWKALYRPALAGVLVACGLAVSEDKLVRGCAVLSKYNTRIHYREHEVDSTVVFTDILRSWQADSNLIDPAKRSFYAFFRNDACPFAGAEAVFCQLKERGIKIGVLTDVAYGMDREYALADLQGLAPYVDVALTSVDVGFRKPHAKGFAALLEQLAVEPGEMAFVGDEAKDMAGANQAGMYSLLINRDEQEKDYAQRKTLHDLADLLEFV
jgi:Predicted hydrolase (HAD superfamily)